MELTKKTQKTIAIVCGVILIGLIAALLLRQTNISVPSNNKAADNKQADKKDSEADDKKSTSKPSTAKATGSYRYQAISGDSYTLFARDAIQKYANDNKIELTSDQLLLAESTLAEQAGLPLLDIGQEVSIDQKAVAAVVDAKTTPAVEKTAPVETKQTEEASSEPKKDADSKAKPEPKSKTDSEPKPGDYRYTATAGDSYSLLARKAISEYSEANKLELSNEQRIAAETNLAHAAGLPQLAEGQTVEFDSSELKAAIDDANSLSNDELAGWQPYAALADL